MLRAGALGGTGTADGPGAAARFNDPWDVIADAAGNLFVAEFSNHTIRKISPSGVVTTLAGQGETSGFVDGVGTLARFNAPLGLAFDPSGSLLVADTLNHSIRKVTQAGVVTTIAGTGQIGSTDTTPPFSVTSFNRPQGIATNPAGDAFIADWGNSRVRKLTPAGVVSTIAGGGALSSPGRLVVSGGNVLVADACAIRQVSPSNVITTVAGGTCGNVDGTGAAARFDSPISMRIDAANVVWLNANSAVRKMTPAFTFTTHQSLPASSRGMALGPSGSVFVVGMNQVQSVSASGVVTTIAGTDAQAGDVDGSALVARFRRPGPVAVDGSGNAYVADLENGTIRKVSQTGAVTTLAGSPGLVGSTDGIGAAARFDFRLLYQTPANWSAGLAVDSVGNVYIADTGNHTIRKLYTTGEVTTFAGSAGLSGSTNGTGSAARFSRPTGLAIDAAGTLFVADTDNFIIRKVTSAGVVTTLAGRPGVGGDTDGMGSAARFGRVQGLAIDAAGNLFVSDSWPSIRKVTPAGLVTTIAGGTVGSADGLGASAQFNGPGAIAVDASGTLFVADTNNCAIRKVTQAGVVTTVVGVAGSAGAQPGLLPASLNRVRGLALSPTGLVVTSENAVFDVTF